MGTAAPLGDLPRPRLVGVASGILWRYLVLGAVAFEVFAGPRIPIPALGAIGAGGVLVGFWFRRGWAPAAWRASMLGWATAASAGLVLFPAILVLSIVVVTVEPFVLLRGRRQAGDRSRRDGFAPSASRQRSVTPTAPVPDWPRAPRR